MTDRTDPAAPSRAMPGEPPPDDLQWTRKPVAPDLARMAGRFVNEPDDAVPGIRRTAGAAPGKQDST